MEYLKFNLNDLNTTVINSFIRLKKYCELENFKGWDPYDGLNSELVKILPFKNNNYFRLMWIQLNRRNPINLRYFFLIPKDYNPKGLGLFLSGYCNIYKKNNKKEYLSTMKLLIDKIFSLASKGYSGVCWGYNFDWQSRTFFIPKYTPNVIVSTFVGNALLDVYNINKNRLLLDTARSTCNFILNDLKRSYDKNNNFCFSYSPVDSSKIFNASLLASRFLARVYRHTNEKILFENAKRSIKYCVDKQNPDGSWFYGTDSNQNWIDSFHTAYNLESIYEYQIFSGDTTYNNVYNKGFQYYIRTFFTDKGIPKYFHNSIYPVNIHSVSQLIILLSKTNLLDENSELLKKVLGWTYKNMWDNKRGYFFYELHKGYKITIPYIRWAQAWMFYALSYLVNI